MSELSPNSPSSPVESLGSDRFSGPNEAWSSLENYEDPRLSEPPVAIGYDPSRVVAMSQAEIDNLSDDLFAKDDAEQSRAWLNDVLIEKGFSEQDLESGVVAVEIDGELVALVTKPDDFGTRLVNAEFTSARKSREEASDEPSQEVSGEQAEIFNKLVGRLKRDLVDAGLEPWLQEGESAHQEMQQEVGDVIGVARQLSRDLMDGRPVSNQALLQFSERVHTLHLAVTNDADTMRAARGCVAGLSSDIEDVSNNARHSLDDESPERKEFYYLTRRLTEVAEDLRSAMSRNVDASEEVSDSLLHLLNAVEELRYSQYGHEMFSGILYECAERLEAGVQNGSLSRRQAKSDFSKIKELLS